MATTARGIVYPTVGTTLTPLANHFASLATSTNTAIDNVVNGSAAFRGLDAAKGAAGQEGRTYYSTDTNQLWFDNGTTWVAEYTTFTPAWSGFTLGNGTHGGQLWRIARNLVQIFAWFKMGTTSSMAGPLKLTLPVAPANAIAGATWEIIGVASANRGGVFFGPLDAIVSTNTPPEVEFLLHGTGGTYANYTGVSSGIPGTWGDTATFSFRGTYAIAG